MPLPLAHTLLCSGKRQEYKALQAQEGICELLEGCQGCSPVSHISPEKQERLLHKGELLNRSCCLLLLGLTQLTEASLMLPWVTVLSGWDHRKQLWWKLPHSAKASHTGFKGLFFSNVKGNSLPVSSYFFWSALLIFSNSVFTYIFQLGEIS